MGHYDTCRDGNCGVCGQALGHCNCEKHRANIAKRRVNVNVIEPTAPVGVVEDSKFNNKKEKSEKSDIYEVELTGEEANVLMNFFEEQMKLHTGKKMYWYYYGRMNYLKNRYCI